MTHSIHFDATYFRNKQVKNNSLEQFIHSTLHSPFLSSQSLFSSLLLFPAKILATPLFSKPTSIQSFHVDIPSRSFPLCTPVFLS